MSLLRGLFTGLIATLILLPPCLVSRSTPAEAAVVAGHSTGWVRPGNAAAACTDDETWQIRGGIPEALLPLFTAPPKDEEAALHSFVESLLLRLSTKQPEVRNFAEYWMWRSLYSLKLVHLAFSRFNVMFATAPAPENAAFRTAALFCLNQIHRQYPTLSLLPGAMDALEARPIDELVSSSASIKSPLRVLRHGGWEAAFAFALNEIQRAPPGQVPDLKNELKFLAGSGPYEYLLRSQMAAYAGTDRQSLEDAVRFSLAFLRTAEIPAGLKRYEELAHLNLARSYYARTDYARAVQEYKKIQNTSNYFGTTLIEMAWAYIMRHQYSEAVGTAYNLVAGGLKSTFAPDAPVVMSIAYFETCNYPQSYQGLRYFRRIYERSYNWLKAWGEAARKNAAPDLYGSVVSYINDKKASKLPPQIGTELLRSPILIANQQEINLLFDERAAIRKYLAMLPKMREQIPSRSQQQGAMALRNTMLKFSSESPQVQSTLVGQINVDLSQRTGLMVKQLNASVENIQLVEIEIYNSAGEDMIMENARPGYKQTMEEAKAKALKNKRSDGPVLDWGRFPAQQAENGKAEIWEDELGALKTDIVDTCPKK